MEKIIFLESVYKHNVWGGNRLITEFGCNEKGNDIGECWGIAAHANGDCVIKNGNYKGMKLSEMWEKNPTFFGNKTNEKTYPLLTKIIDAQEDLSIQVHPDDNYAFINENGAKGKTECWYIMDCKENASIVIGHKAKTKSQLEEMILSNKWNELIREIPIEKGDFFQINPGTIHAIKGGTLILETQQNSDITYRVYDYERLSNGKLRELHIDKSLDVINVPENSMYNLMKSTKKYEKNVLEELYKCQYYTVFKGIVEKEMEFEQKYPFLAVTVIEGEGFIDGKAIKKGDNFILSSYYGMCKMEGNLEFIASTV